MDINYIEVQRNNKKTVEAHAAENIEQYVKVTSKLASQGSSVVYSCIAVYSYILGCAGLVCPGNKLCHHVRPIHIEKSLHRILFTPTIQTYNRVSPLELSQNHFSCESVICKLKTTPTNAHMTSLFVSRDICNVFNQSELLLPFYNFWEVKVGVDEFNYTQNYTRIEK